MLTQCPLLEVKLSLRLISILPTSRGDCQVPHLRFRKLLNLSLSPSPLSLSPPSLCPTPSLPSLCLPLITGADITDYFNYGFTEETWRLYCEKQRRTKTEVAQLNKIAVSQPTVDTPSCLSLRWYSSRSTVADSSLTGYSNSTHNCCCVLFDDVMKSVSLMTVSLVKSVLKSPFFGIKKCSIYHLRKVRYILCD